MKYTKMQRLDIGQKLYTHEFTLKEAMATYSIGKSTIERYLTDYKLENGIPLHQKHIHAPKVIRKKPESSSPLDIDDYMSMTKEELIDELIRAKVNEVRAKKGYEVKGVGASKEFSSLSNKSSKS